MFENDAKLLHDEILSLSGGALNCLPASRGATGFFRGLLEG